MLISDWDFTFKVTCLRIYMQLKLWENIDKLSPFCDKKNDENLDWAFSCFKSGLPVCRWKIIWKFVNDPLTSILLKRFVSLEYWKMNLYLSLLLSTWLLWFLENYPDSTQHTPERVCSTQPLILSSLLLSSTEREYFPHFSD